MTSSKSGLSSSPPLDLLSANHPWSAFSFFNFLLMPHAETTQTYMHAPTHACIQACMHARKHACTHTCTHARTHACMHAHIYALNHPLSALEKTPTPPNHLWSAFDEPLAPSKWVTSFMNGP